MKIYSIKNEKVGYFNRPIYCESANEAISYIMNVLMSDADRALIHLRNELSLCELGSIDFDTGIITANSEPLTICALDYIFDMIPSERVPRTENELRANIEALRKEFNEFVDNCRF